MKLLKVQIYAEIYRNRVGLVGQARQATQTVDQNRLIDFVHCVCVPFALFFFSQIKQKRLELCNQKHKKKGRGKIVKCKLYTETESRAKCCNI